MNKEERRLWVAMRYVAIRLGDIYTITAFSAMHRDEAHEVFTLTWNGLSSPSAVPAPSVVSVQVPFGSTVEFDRQKDVNAFVWHLVKEALPDR